MGFKFIGEGQDTVMRVTKIHGLNDEKNICEGCGRTGVPMYQFGIGGGWAQLCAFDLYHAYLSGEFTDIIDGYW